METSSPFCNSQLTFYIYLLTCQRNDWRPTLCSSPGPQIPARVEPGECLSLSKVLQACALYNLRPHGPRERGLPQLWEQGAHPRANLASAPAQV